MSDQKKPPVPSFEELQAAQRARDATTKGPAPAPPAVPGQLDPRLMKTTPAAPNPALLHQAKTGLPSRLDPEMLSRLATGGLSASQAYPKGNLEPTQLGPMPKPPSPDERTHIHRPTGVPPPPAPAPKAGTPAGQSSVPPPQRAPSIPHAPASLTARPPAPQGPPPKMPAPPPPGAAPVRPPTNPPPPAYAPRTAAPPAPPVSNTPVAQRAAAPAPPAPPASNTPATLRAPSNSAIPGATASMRSASNVPPPPSHSPTLARNTASNPATMPTQSYSVPPASTASSHPPPEPRPLGADPGSGLSATLLKPISGQKVAIPPEDPSGYGPTVMKPAPPPPANPPRAAPPPPQPSDATTYPTHKVNRAELQNLFADAPTTPRMPAAPPSKSPQPKLDAAAEADERTPVQAPIPVQAPPPRSISSPVANVADVPMPHLEKPPALNSKSLLDMGPAVAPPASDSVPVGRSETVNLRAPSREDLPPAPSRAPRALVEIPPDERTPVKVNAAFATTQPGMPGPFAKKGARATDLAVTPVDAEAQPGEHLEPVTLSQGQTPALGDALDPSFRSEAVPALETQMRPVKGELVAAPASLFRRCVAFTVDFALVGGLCVGLLYLASMVKGVKAVPANLSDLDILLYRMHALDKLLIPSLALCALVALVYATVFASALGGRTPGRLVTGIRLVTSAGEPPGLVRALLRAVFSFVSFALCLSGFWLALFDRKGQTLHDKLTRTFVVRPL